MTGLKGAIREIVKNKNEVIRKEREKLDAAEWSNRILSSYIALLAKEGELRIKRDDVSRVLGSFRADVSREDDSYVIRLREISQDSAGREDDGGTQQI